MRHTLRLAWFYVNALGLNVIPIRRDGDRKRPALREWKPYREHRATQEELQRWFGNRTAHGLAAICGKISGGLTVLDIDDRSLAQRILDANPSLLESTLCARTGGGNLHIYVKTPAPPAKFNLRRDRVPQPIDVQGEGGYIIMPPSLHASGNRYRWLPGCGRNILFVPEFPLWFRQVLARADVQRDPQPPRLAQRYADGGAGHELTGAILGILQELSGEPGQVRGREVWFHCPFHEDLLPSLSTNTLRPVWHCFGCQEGGGIRRLRELQGAR